MVALFCFPSRSLLRALQLPFSFSTSFRADASLASCRLTHEKMGKMRGNALGAWLNESAYYFNIVGAAGGI